MMQWLKKFEESAKKDIQKYEGIMSKWGVDEIVNELREYDNEGLEMILEAVRREHPCFKCESFSSRNCRQCTSDLFGNTFAEKVFRNMVFLVEKEKEGEENTGDAKYEDAVEALYRFVEIIEGWEELDVVKSDLFNYSHDYLLALSSVMFDKAKEQGREWSLKEKLFDAMIDTQIEDNKNWY